MVKLIPVNYYGLCYPHGITAPLSEVAGHFGKCTVATQLPFSLHTEYSAAPRRLSKLAMEYASIRESVRDGVPLLWTSEAWAEDFAAFLRQLCGAVPPQVLELHPPFKFYCNIEQFFHRYSIFEAILRQWAPDTLVVIENRFGTSLKTQKNTPVPFLLRAYQDFVAVSQALDSSGLRLRFAFDVPQLLSAHRLLVQTQKLVPLLEHMKQIRHNIASIHLWGRIGRASHVGTLDTMFAGNATLKAQFLCALYELLDDGRPRYFVPEVNRQNQADFSAIIQDLLDAGFTFDASLPSWKPSCAAL